MPPNTINVDRRTKYGNPFKVGEPTPAGLPVATTEAAVWLFRQYAEGMLINDPHWLDDLRGKDVGCWCKPGACCHGDVLIELANRPKPEIK